MKKSIKKKNGKSLFQNYLYIFLGIILLISLYIIGSASASLSMNSIRSSAYSQLTPVPTVLLYPTVKPTQTDAGSYKQEVSTVCTNSTCDTTLSKTGKCPVGYFKYIPTACRELLPTPAPKETGIMCYTNTCQTKYISNATSCPTGMYSYVPELCIKTCYMSYPNCLEIKVYRGESCPDGGKAKNTPTRTLECNGITSKKEDGKDCLADSECISDFCAWSKCAQPHQYIYGHWCRENRYCQSNLCERGECH